MKLIKRAFLAISVCLSFAAHSQSLGNLPTGYIGYVGNPATGVNNSYTFSFTAANSGSDYVGFAVRQDPAFWSFTNPSVTAAGSSANLLTNASLSAGGAVQVTTNNGTQTIQAPTGWGVWYQNGTYPAAAGTWQSGQWYDGAVGSYDGIYQGITVSSGITYTVSFNALSTSQASSLQQAIIGVYAGACNNVTLAASSCVPVSTAGFTPIAQPNQTVNAGNPSAPPVPPSAPSAPTVVSTAAGTPFVTTTSTNGAPVITSQTSYGASAVASTSVNGTPTTAQDTAYARGQASATLPITKTVSTNVYTPVQTTTVTTTPYTTVTTTTVPVTVTTVTTPTTVTTYSDNSTTTTNGTPVTTTSAGAPIVTTQTTGGNQVATVVVDSVNQQTSQASQQYSTRIDMYNQLSTVNSQINSAMTSDPLSRARINDGAISLRNGKDTDVYIIGTGMQTNNINTYKATTGMFGVGADFIVDRDLLLGWQYNRANSNMSGGSAGGSEYKDMFGIYGIQSIDDWLVKFDLGYAMNQYSSYHTLPALGLGNSSTTNGHDYFGSARLYTPDAKNVDDWLSGLRAFVGQGYEHDQMNGVTESGSPLTAMTYDPTNSHTWTSEAGVAYYLKLDKDWSIGSELSANNRQQKTELISLSYKTTDNSSILLKAITQQTNSGVNNAIQAWARINF